MSMFGSRHSPPPPPPARPPVLVPPPATGAKHTPFSLIGGDVAVTGNLSATVDIHIDGRIDGDLTCATLVQGAESVIRGNIVAKAARIAGQVEGTITADNLVIERSARIFGDCRYGTLAVDNGAQVEGRFSAQSTIVMPAELDAPEEDYVDVVEEEEPYLR
ncbi:polymer-forming cytoskeletal protein [Sphingomonas sp. BK235]|uniref:bactofilin family protein n=1 Tax=Sphingomonas sp. BK235 TaxID=2512131 RepID=UPI0010E97EBD|nr:polymer-forming cytoskeletal protein [Sphingomonas sp. BK235]TCP35000.1 polymer-forming protein [Sphingomonas sp. BK235]